MEITRKEKELLGKLNNFGLHGITASFVYNEEDTAVLYGLIKKLKEEFYENR